MIDANSQFFAILTNVGMAKQANADALGIPWKITEMGVGDASGTDPIPNAAQTTLINEWRRRPLNQLKIDPNNPAVIIAEQIIPADEGGKWIREIGLYDADGDLVAVANCAPSFKPVLSQGSGRTQIVRMNFIVTSAGNITLKIDPAIVLASRAYVDAAILEVLPKNKTPGEWTRVKTNNLGLVVSGDNPDTLAGMGIKDTYTKVEIAEMIAQASALPVGTMVAFPKAVVAPGFLEVDGSVQSIATYPDLFAYLGTTFNTGGEGAGNFRLPESRAEFLRGWDHGRGVDAGRTVGSTQKGSLVALDTGAIGVQSVHFTGSASVANAQQASGLDAYLLADYPNLDIGGASGYSTALPGLPAETASGVARPRNLAVMWCIKAWNAPINQGNIDIAALAAQVIAATPKDYVVGFATAMNVAAPTTTIDVAPGTARGASNPVFSLANISCVLQAAGAWSPGSGGNKLDAGARVALTWYHLFSLRKIAGGEADLLLSPSLAAPAVPPGYELVTRLKGRALKTDASGNIIPFINTGNSTDWKTLQPDMTLTMGAPGSFTIIVSAPPGVRVRSRHYASIIGDGPTIYVRSPDANAATMKSLIAGAGFAGGIAQNNGSIAGENIAGYCEASTNLSAQVVVQALSAPGYDMPEVKLFTLGWTED